MTKLTNALDTTCPRFGYTGAYGYIAKENTTPFLVVQDIKSAESGPICLRLTVILLDCQVLLTDGLAYLRRGDRLVLPSPYNSSMPKAGRANLAHTYNGRGQMQIGE